MNPIHLADGFAAHCARWAADLRAPPAARQAVARAAKAVSLATAAGHVCLPLAELAENAAEAEDLAPRLLASGVVGAPDAGGRLRVVAPERCLLACWTSSFRPAPVAARTGRSSPWPWPWKIA